MVGFFRYILRHDNQIWGPIVENFDFYICMRDTKRLPLAIKTTR